MSEEKKPEEPNPADQEPAQRFSAGKIHIHKLVKVAKGVDLMYKENSNFPKQRRNGQFIKELLEHHGFTVVEKSNQVSGAPLVKLFVSKDEDAGLTYEQVLQILDADNENFELHLTNRPPQES